MDSNGSLWVLIGPYASLWVLLCMHLYDIFWVPMGPYAFVRILLGFYGFL